MRILVTGGAGFIGSHTCVELLENGYDVTVIDNLYNSSAKAIDRVREISGKDLTFVKGDILDRECLDTIFESQKIDAVIHFAGLKAVGESVHKPVEYYSNNITRLPKSARRGSARIPTDGPNGCWSRFSPTCIRPTLSGM